MNAATRHGGFTLIEVLSVVFLTTILFTLAVNLYVDLSTQSNRAAANTREWRQAVALIDRVASDLERALMVQKPAETDPLSHPWLFFAEPRYSESGADQLKFVVRRPPGRATEGPGSDLAFVSYLLRNNENGEGYQLLRWSEVGLPDRLEHELPNADDAVLVSDAIADFGVRFLGESGEWQDRWDSSQLLESSSLPLAAEVTVAMLGEDGAASEVVPAVSRQVDLPVRPLDLEILTDPERYADGAAGAEGAEGGDDDEECLTLAECIDPSVLGADGRGCLDSIGEQVDARTIAQFFEQAADQCAAPFLSRCPGHPSIRPQCR